MPQYQCHKVVRALQIKEIKANSTREFEIFFEDEGSMPILVDLKWMAKHEPEVGGYYVAYEDGYRSYSPAKAFEDGYDLIQACEGCGEMAVLQEDDGMNNLCPACIQLGIGETETSNG